MTTSLERHAKIQIQELCNSPKPSSFRGFQPVTNDSTYLPVQNLRRQGVDREHLQRKGIQVRIERILSHRFVVMLEPGGACAHL